MSWCKKICIILFVAIITVTLLYLYRAHRPPYTIPSGLERTVDFSHFSEKENIAPIAIIGSGPAGLSAALYGARAGTHTVVFAGATPGGQLTGTSDIENWPGVPKVRGVDVMNTLKVQAQTFGVEYVLDSVKKLDVSRWPFVLKTSDGVTVNALSVIIATGAHPRTLGIEGECQYWGKGVTTCAVCDAPYYKDADVIVVGGGDTAAEEAMQLAPYARAIKMMVRADKMRASAIMQDRLRAYPNITIQFNTEVKEIMGDGTHVTGVELLNNKTGQHSALDIDGVFLAIGHIPNTQMARSQLTLDENSLIKLMHPTQQTSVKGVFAAGEVSDGLYRQAGVAAGDGIKAALDALSFLRDIGFSDVEADRLSDQFYKPTFRAQIPPLEVINSLDELDSKVTKAKGIVVLDFYADYCPSCLAMMPAMEEIAHEFRDSATFYKVDAGVSEDIAKHLFVTCLPTVLIFKDGKIAARHTKAMNKQELRDMIKAIQ